MRQKKLFNLLTTLLLLIAFQVNSQHEETQEAKELDTAEAGKKRV